MVIPKTLRPLSCVNALKLMSPEPTSTFTPGSTLIVSALTLSVTPGAVTLPVNWTVSPPRPPLIVSVLSAGERTLCDSASSKTVAESGRKSLTSMEVPAPFIETLKRSLSPISVVVPERSAPLMLTFPAEMEIGSRPA